jgi:vacuolar protein sorting-associated protein 45
MPQTPRLVVAFIVGGTTYEEARAVAEANAAAERGQGWSAGMRIILGGTGVQNSASFMAQIREMMMNERHSR